MELTMMADSKTNVEFTTKCENPVINKMSLLKVLILSLHWKKIKADGT